MASLLKGGPTSAYNEIGTHEMDPMIERVLLLKQEAFVYKIPQNQVCHGMQIHFAQKILSLFRNVMISKTIIICIFRFLLMNQLVGKLRDGI